MKGVVKDVKSIIKNDVKITLKELKLLIKIIGSQKEVKLLIKIIDFHIRVEKIVLDINNWGELKGEMDLYQNGKETVKKINKDMKHIIKNIHNV